MLHLDDRWIWDFWFALDGSDVHVFFLQAPRALGDPEQRHWNVSIGHAVSRDLRRWEVLPDALTPASAPAWDDYTTWTGSVVRSDQGWAMFYTGTSHAENGLVQRVGLATSQDLVGWTRDGVVTEADPSAYEVLADEAWYEQAWRDPWVFMNPADGRYHMLVTARARLGDPAGRGVIGHARSVDLRSWEVLPPMTNPMGFGHLEVPQLMELDGRWYLLFCSDLRTQAPERRRAGGGTGTYYLVADTPTGPFRLLGNGVLDADAVGSTYAGRLLVDQSGTPWYLAWRRTAADGSFVGDLDDPRSVSVDPDGSLRLGPRVLLDQRH